MQPEILHQLAVPGAVVSLFDHTPVLRHALHRKNRQLAALGLPPDSPPGASQGPGLEHPVVAAALQVETQPVRVVDSGTQRALGVMRGRRKPRQVRRGPAGERV